MHIDKLLDSIKIQSQECAADIVLKVDPSWTQGRTLYGGVSAALAYQAIREAVDAQSLMRSFNTGFIGPIEADKEFSIQVEILRQGKNVTQVMARLLQNDKVALVSQASFGVDRPSKILVENNLEHEMQAPKKANFLPPIPKVTPKFIGHFDLAKSEGGWPFTGKKHSHTYGWMRFKRPPNTLTEAHLVALIDAWPPTVLQQLKWPAAASTVNWNLEFVHPHKPFKPENWFAYQAKTRHAQNGYANTEADIWDSSGSLVAISRQSVAVFD